MLLDELPDAVVIANTENILYVNREAWSLLKCQSQQGNEMTLNNLDGVFCHDVGTCAILTPVD